MGPWPQVASILRYSTPVRIPLRLSPMNKRSRLSFVAVVLCVIAAIISYKLLVKHVTGSSGSAWFEAGCSDGAAPGAANCAAVLASPYSYIPVKHPDGPPGRPHIPVALLGLMYYSALGVWLIGIGGPSRERRSVHLLPLFVVGFGLAVSAYYTKVMFSVLDEWCSWCLATHILNLLIAVCVVLMWPRGAAASAAAVPESEVISAQGAAVLAALRGLAAHPSRRLVWVTLLAIVAVCYCELNMLGLKTWRRTADMRTAEFGACLKVVNEIKGDSELLIALWQSGEVKEIDRRTDDPVRVRAGISPSEPPLDVVVFSDFECRSCGRFARFFENEVVPLFDGRISRTFKHYPIDQACNPRVKRTMHPHACEGANMAEAARLTAGSDGFWRAHDFLFENRDDLAQGAITVERVAEAIGVEPAALRNAVSSEQINRRLSEDADQAKACEIAGTPGVFVDGKPVHTLAKTEIGFWDRLAEMYWTRIGVARPESTRLTAPAEHAEDPTPDSPDPTDAP